MSIDNRIIKFLYLRKNDGKYYDVSYLFNVSNHDNYFNNIDYPRDLTKKSPYDNIPIGIRFRVVKQFERSLKKKLVDDHVIALEKHGYIEKRCAGEIRSSMIPSGDDPWDANNSICIITTSGIEYYERRKTRRVSKISLIIAFLALLVAILSMVLNHK